MRASVAHPTISSVNELQQLHGWQAEGKISADCENNCCLLVAAFIVDHNLPDAHFGTAESGLLGSIAFSLARSRAGKILHASLQPNQRLIRYRCRLTHA